MSANNLFVSPRQLPSGKFHAVVQRELPRNPSDMFHMSPEHFIDDRKVIDVEVLPILYNDRQEAIREGEKYLNNHYLRTFTVRH